MENKYAARNIQFRQSKRNKEQLSYNNHVHAFFLSFCINLFLHYYPFSVGVCWPSGNNYVTFIYFNPCSVWQMAKCEKEQRDLPINAGRTHVISWLAAGERRLTEGW